MYKERVGIDRGKVAMKARLIAGCCDDHQLAVPGVRKDLAQPIRSQDTADSEGHGRCLVAGRKGHRFGKNIARRDEGIADTHRKNRAVGTDPHSSSVVGLSTSDSRYTVSMVAIVALIGRSRIIVTLEEVPASDIIDVAVAVIIYRRR